MRLNEAIDSYVAALKERGCSARTVVAYQAELRQLARFLETQGATAAGEVDRDSLAAFLAVPTPSGSPPAPGTHNRKVTVLKSFFDHLVNADLLPSSPAEALPYHKEPRRERPTLSARDVDKLLKAAEALPIGSGRLVGRDQAIVAVLFNVGLRVAELVALDVHQVDLAQGLLLGVKRKGGLEMPLPLNKAVKEHLERWRKARAAMLPRTAALFPSRKGGRLSRRSVEERLARLGQLAGFSFRVHPHMLRHSFATALLASGANLEVARRLLGHSSLATTARYAHPDQAALKEAVERLGQGPRRRRKKTTGPPEPSDPS